MTTPESNARSAPSMEPKLTGPKRQHFLPRFYLDGFTKGGMLALYDRKLGEIRVQQPINTGVIGHFYTLEDSEGRRRFELEDLLCDYEGKASKIIAKLVAKEEINADERTDLAIFVALAAFRTPDMLDSLKAFNSGLVDSMAKKMFAEVEQVKAWMRKKENPSMSEEELEKEAQELVTFANSDSYTVTTNHRWAISMAMEIAFSIAPIFAGRDWIVTHRDNHKKSFVTTDAPVVLTTVAPRENNFYGVGFGNADSLVIFPLTESCVLLMHGKSGRLEHGQANAQQVRQINLALSEHCQRFVIGRDEALVRSLSDNLGLANKTWQPKMQLAE